MDLAHVKDDELPMFNEAAFRLAEAITKKGTPEEILKDAILNELPDNLKPEDKLEFMNDLFERVHQIIQMYDSSAIETPQIEVQVEVHDA